MPDAAGTATHADGVVRPGSWWRRNRLALLALAMLIPATGFGVLWQEWQRWYGTGVVPYRSVIAEEKAAVELAGAEWGPVRSTEIEDLSGLDVPDDATVIAVALPVDPESDRVSCSSPELVQQSTGRTWKPVRSEIGLGYDADEPDRCSSLETAPYELIVAFVLPDDVDGPFWVDVAPRAADGAFVRFSIDP